MDKRVYKRHQHQHYQQLGFFRHLLIYHPWVLSTVGILLSVVGAATVYVVTGSRHVGRSAGPKPSVQQLLQRQLKRDQRALDKGALTYSYFRRLYTGVPVTLKATVTDLGKHPRGMFTAAELSYTLGLVVYPGDVPTGGFVGLSITSCTHMKCQKLNASPVQAIAGKGSRRSWYWHLTPREPGPASIVLSASIYDGKKGPTLSQEIIPIKITVVPTAEFNRARKSKQLARATGFISSTAVLISGVFGAVAAIFGACVAAVKLLRRFRQKNAAKRAQTEAERKQQEEAERALQTARQRQEEVERQKQDPVWKRPL